VSKWPSTLRNSEHGLLTILYSSEMQSRMGVVCSFHTLVAAIFAAAGLEGVANMMNPTPLRQWVIGFVDGDWLGAPLPVRS
jgi:hypothetical protein